MSRIKTPSKPNDITTKILVDLEKAMGMTPNIFKIMANSPIVLEGYLTFSATLSKGTLSAQDREQIALTVAGFNHCEYCASAHTALATKAGVSSEETKKNLHGTSDSPRTTALIKFVLAILKTKGNITNDELAALRTAKFTDEQVVEIVAIICVNIFTNYFNHVADTEIDFPKVSLG